MGRRLREGEIDLTRVAGAYTKEWYDMMVRIWTDRIGMMGILHTGELRRSVGGAGLNINGLEITAAYRFLQYGLYVDAGTGNGYTHAAKTGRRNDLGQLEFLDEDYRKEHNMGKARESRPWYSKSWHISKLVLRDKLSDLMGEAFIGLFDKLE